MFPNGGGDTEPWYWGKNFTKAEEVCAEYNKKMGLTEKDVLEIIGSSMRASRGEGHAGKD